MYFFLNNELNILLWHFIKAIFHPQSGDIHIEKEVHETMSQVEQKSEECKYLHESTANTEQDKMIPDVTSQGNVINESIRCIISVSK